MDLARLSPDLKELRRRNRAHGMLVGLVSVCLLLSLVLIVRILGTERTVVTPPNLSKSFWVVSGKASASWLEQMGSYVAWLILDVSPATIDWKKDELLSWVAPDHHGQLKIRQEVEAERLKRMNASTSFLPQQFVPSEETQSVVVRGRVKTLVNGQETSTESKSYVAEFQYAGGRPLLRTFKEIPHDQQAAANGPASDGDAQPN